MQPSIHQQQTDLTKALEQQVSRLLKAGHVVIESSSLESVSRYFDSKPTDYPDLLAWMVASNAAEWDTPGKRLEDRVKSLTEAGTCGFRALLSTAQTPDETAIMAAFSKLDSLNRVLGWCYPHGLGALITPLRELSALLRDFWKSHFYQIYLSPKTFTPQPSLVHGTSKSDSSGHVACLRETGIHPCCSKWLRMWRSLPKRHRPPETPVVSELAHSW